MADPANTPPPRLRTVFLDRDGVLNRKLPEGRYVITWNDFEMLPGVPQAVARLNRAGLRVIVLTNQRGIALGLYSAHDVRSIHSALDHELAKQGAHIDAYYICPHDVHECNCRKPKPGLFQQACGDYPDISPATSLILGDSLSDIEFGRNLGMRAIFLEGDADSRKPGASIARSLADQSFHSLPEAVDGILAGQSGKG